MFEGVFEEAESDSDDHIEQIYDEGEDANDDAEEIGSAHGLALALLKDSGRAWVEDVWDGEEELPAGRDAMFDEGGLFL